MEDEIKFQSIKSTLKNLHESTELEEREKYSTRLIEIQARKTLIELEGRAAYFKLRKEWSFFLMCLLGLCVVFQFGITILVGIHYLDYLKYQWFINLVMGENFAQIIGLCVIVVKFLFPQHPEK